MYKLRGISVIFLTIAPKVDLLVVLGRILLWYKTSFVSQNLIVEVVYGPKLLPYCPMLAKAKEIDLETNS